MSFVVRRIDPIGRLGIKYAGALARWQSRCSFGSQKTTNRIPPEVLIDGI